MSKAWKELDLEGGGLQAVNARLAREMRTRPAAYAAWILFPLGLHRFYLREPLGGAGFLALSAATLALAGFGPAAWWLLPLIIGVSWALVDLWWIDRRVTDYNKELRKQLFLRKGQEPPQDYRGRYTSDEDARRELDEYQQLKEAEKPGNQAWPVATTRPATPAASAACRASTSRKPCCARCARTKTKATGTTDRRLHKIAEVAPPPVAATPDGMARGAQFSPGRHTPLASCGGGAVCLRLSTSTNTDSVNSESCLRYSLRSFTDSGICATMNPVIALRYCTATMGCCAFGSTSVNRSWTF